MKIIFLNFLLFTSNLFTLQAQEKLIPTELKSFIQKGYGALDFAKQDLNGDKLPDYILILKVKGEDTMTFDNPNWEAARPLLLILRQSNGSLKQTVSNNDLILCRQCGGVMGDPYQELTVKPGEFRANFYGGSSWRWTEGYTFRYDNIKRDWFLQTHASSSFQSGDPEKTLEEKIINRSEIGDISLQNFTPYYNADSSTWKVNVVKTFFFTSPDIKSKRKKAYLVKGNLVTSIKKFKSFIECSFTNSKEATSYGFILKKDLLLIQSNNPKPIR